MKTTVEQFQDHFNEVIRGVELYTIYVRARELQEQSIKVTEALKKECTQHKQASINTHDEDAANAFLAFESIAESVINYLRFFIALKADQIDEAWDHLISAQSAAAIAMKAHAVASHLDSYIQILHAHEELLFPKPTFFSPSFVVEESNCSICGAEYGECEHVKCRPYMGQICARVIKKARLIEVSIVADPADKRRRALHFRDGNIWRHAFTHRVVPADRVQQLPNEFPPQPPLV